MLPLTKTASASPAQSVTTPPASRDEQRAGGDVPDAQTELEEPVEDTGADVCEIEARGSGAAKVLESGERPLHHGEVPRQPLLAPEREAGCDDPGPGMGRDREPSSALDRSRPRPSAALHDAPISGAVTAPTTGRPSSTSATLTPTTGNPRRKLVVPSIGSTTHMRSDLDPPASSARIGMSGAPALQDLDRSPLGSAIDLGDVVAGALDLADQRRRAGVGSDDQLRRRGSRGDGELTQGFALLHPKRVRGAGATTSCAQPGAASGATRMNCAGSRPPLLSNASIASTSHGPARWNPCAMRAAELVEALDLQRRLDPFGDERQAERLAVTDDGARELAARVGIAELGDQRARDLEDVDRKAAQIGERRVAGADVVDRDVHARPLERVESGDRAVQILEHHVLGDLEDQARRDRPAPPRGSGSPARRARA